VDHGFLVGIVTRGDLLRPVPRGGKLGRLAQRVLRGRRSREAPAPAFPRAPGRRPPSGATVARDVMTADDLVTVTGTTSTEQATELLLHHRFTALPVVDDGGRLVGIVSEADLIRDPLAGRPGPRPRTVAAAMTTDVLTLQPDAALSDLARALSEGGLRVVPIVDDGRRLLGVVSRGDLLRLPVPAPPENIEGRAAPTA
jgi:CBS domain-containing protein